MPATCVVGIDLGGSKLLAGAVGADLTVHHRARRAVAGLDQGALLDAIVDVVAEIQTAGADAIEAVGCGIPCTFDRARGIAVQAVNLPLRDIAFADVMAERLGLPVVADNDANAAIVAEHRAGAARGARNAALLAIGTGIGGGLVLDGRPYRGSLGAGAELGHMVVDLDGPRCQGSCPNRGCLEAVASGTALAREATRLAVERPASALGQAHAAGREITGALATELAHDGDEAAREAIALIGGRLGVGISNLVNILDPDVVVVGGGVIGAGELLLAPARAAVAERALEPGRDHVRIVAAHFGAEAGMIGAAALAWDAVAARAVSS